MFLPVHLENSRLNAGLKKKILMIKKRKRKKKSKDFMHIININKIYWGKI